ncbi:DUF5610 domain-containing protein [Pseudomonas sp. JS3066]|jgi:hypothetical protein|uniref:DUF5610 domain-containing protein n=1 Tax=unclassified Pseudomonas TaxID=196821 RepID=UPI000EA97EB4|nr:MULTISPECIES: DUF5610 domain-containing protein [unclassified Pseudomonas]AYF87369.1 hypothetical protein D6Z43_09450 [Pseudomonas sp. DY-1]WVK95103.1 DUF5610 domain-containing protein [Pseudomonas sp. JS3066]
MNALAPFASSTQRSTVSGMPAALARKQVNAQETLARRLGEQLGLEPGALSDKASKYTPEKVADRVLGFIDQRLRSESANGADTAKLQGLLDQARAGIQKGFDDARKILDGLGVLGGKVAEDIDDTFDRIQDGLDQLQKTYLQPATTTEPGGAVAVAGYSERFQAQAETFDLEVKTRDGDKLRISIAQASASYSRSTLAAASDGKTSLLVGSSHSSSLQIGAWQIEIEGDLDDEEKAALSDLLGQVQDISSKFYSGDLAGAFDRAMALDMDGEQLASMSLHLTQTKVMQAADAYGAVAQQGGQAASAVNGNLKDYANSLLDALRSAGELAENGRDTLKQLLKGGFALDERFDSTQLAKAEALNNRLLDGLQPLLDKGQGKSTDA